MQPLSDERRRYVLHQRLVLRWIREGGVVAAAGGLHRGEHSTFELSETLSAGAALQLTCNLREVGKACRYLNHYVVYLFNCEHESEYVMRGLPNESTPIFEATHASVAERPLRRLSAACYAGRFPHLRLDIYEAPEAMPPNSGTVPLARVTLPRGLCAIVYQNAPAEKTANLPDPLSQLSLSTPRPGSMDRSESYPRTYQTIA